MNSNENKVWTVPCVRLAKSGPNMHAEASKRPLGPVLKLVGQASGVLGF